MTYQEYVDKFRDVQLSGRLQEIEKPWSEEDFKFFSEPIKKTSELKDNPPFRLSYKNFYLNLRQAIERGAASNKEERLKELDNIYQETAAKLNLL